MKKKKVYTTYIHKFKVGIKRAPFPSQKKNSLLGDSRDSLSLFHNGNNILIFGVQTKILSFVPKV